MPDTSSQQNTSTLVSADARDLRIAPRKMRLLTNLVKHMPVDRALTQLEFTHKKGAGMLAKLIRSAIANAEHNFSLDSSTLVIKSATCDMGKTMKRSFPRARGSAFVIRRKMSHVHLVLESKGKAKPGRRVMPVKPVEEKVVKDESILENESGTVAPKQDKPKAPTKTNEQRKMNTVQQKRRLFTRKTGE